MYLSSMNENVSRNTPAYVFEIQQLFLQQNLPVGTEDAMVAVASGLAKKTALRASLERALRSIIHRESGRINSMELLSLIMTASASPVEPLPTDRMERAMHQTLGFILEVREQLEDVREVDLSSGMMRSSERRRSRSESMISTGPLEKFSLRGSNRVLLGIALCGLLVASLVIGISRYRNHAGENVAQTDAPSISRPEAQQDATDSVAGTARQGSPPFRNAPFRPKTSVQRSREDEAQRTPTPQIAPAVAIQTRALHIGNPRLNSAPPRTNPGMVSVSHPRINSKENLAAPTQPGRAVAADVSTAVLAPAISTGNKSRSAAPSRGIVQSGSAGIMAANLISSPTPAYPTAASSARVEGEVTVNALVGKDGNVLHATVVSGPLLLREAALKAVEQWQYRPYLVSGKPAEMTTTAIVAFELTRD